MNAKTGPSHVMCEPEPTRNDEKKSSEFRKPNFLLLSREQYHKKSLGAYCYFQISENQRKKVYFNDGILIRYRRLGDNSLAYA